MPITILAFLVIFSVVVFIHEFGHFLVAKLSGARVEEVGFGYPPRILRLGKRGDTEYTLNALPIGGFVRVTGDEKPDDPRSLTRKKPWVRALFLLAGPLMNLLLAAFLFMVTFMSGVPGPGVGVYEVQAQSPAEQAGLAAGDTILRVDGLDVNSPTELQALVQERLGQEVTLVVNRGGQDLPQPLKLTPRVPASADEGAMGVSIGSSTIKVYYSLFRAVGLGARQALRLVVLIVSGLVDMVRGLIPADLTGPIGIAQMTGHVARSGLPSLIEWTGFLSVNLFILNLLPIPALDGGRLIFVGLEVLRGGRRVDPKKEGLVHFVGLVALLGLFLVISYFDVVRLVRGVG